MKLLRYGPAGREKPGILDASGNIRDLSGIIPDITPQTIAHELGRLSARDMEKLPIVPSDVTIGPPVSGVDKIVCIELDYRKHVKESGMDIPPEPLVFMKATTSIAGPNDPVMRPKGATRVDWEVEYAIIMARRRAMSARTG